MIECTQRVICLEDFMDNSHFTDSQQVLKQLRQQMGMNRREFCETFDIPYRTVTEWELGNRNAAGMYCGFWNIIYGFKNKIMLCHIQKMRGSKPTGF